MGLISVAFVQTSRADVDQAEMTWDMLGLMWQSSVKASGSSLEASPSVSSGAVGNVIKAHRAIRLSNMRLASQYPEVFSKTFWKPRNSSTTWTKAGESWPFHSRHRQSRPGPPARGALVGQVARASTPRSRRGPNGTTQGDRMAVACATHRTQGRMVLSSILSALPVPSKNLCQGRTR